METRHIRPRDKAILVPAPYTGFLPVEGAIVEWNTHWRRAVMRGDAVLVETPVVDAAPAEEGPRHTRRARGTQDEG